MTSSLLLCTTRVLLGASCALLVGCSSPDDTETARDVPATTGPTAPTTPAGLGSERVSTNERILSATDVPVADVPGFRDAWIGPGPLTAADLADTTAGWFVSVNPPDSQVEAFYVADTDDLGYLDDAGTSPTLQVTYRDDAQLTDYLEDRYDVDDSVVIGTTSTLGVDVEVFTHGNEGAYATFVDVPGDRFVEIQAEGFAGDEDFNDLDALAVALGSLAPYDRDDLG